MRMELALENGRPVAEMDDQELARMVSSATALLDLNPTLPVRVTLTQLTAEIQREQNKRPGTPGCQLRETHDFTDAELDAAIQHANAMRQLRPRHGVQLVMANFQLSLMVEREQRRMGRTPEGAGS